MALFITVLMLLLPSITSAQGMSSDSESVTVTVNHDDGGKTGKRHIHDMLDALNEGGCNAMHRDVLVAVIAEPLAQRWAKQNGLSIVAVTDEVETGGWWMHRSVSEKLTQNCTQALVILDQSRHKTLPAWIDGFVIPE